MNNVVYRYQSSVPVKYMYFSAAVCLAVLLCTVCILYCYCIEPTVEQKNIPGIIPNIFGFLLLFISYQVY